MATPNELVIPVADAEPSVNLTAAPETGPLAVESLEASDTIDPAVVDVTPR